MSRCAPHLAILLSTLSLVALPAFAQTLSVTPASAHPEQPATVAGSGFADAEAVDVYIDTTDTLLLVSSSTGTLSASLTMPANLLPGEHYLTAIGRRSGDAAQVAFKVSTPWTEPGFSASHRGWNPYENLLGSDNAGTLGLSWSGGSSGSGATPVVDGGTVYMSTQFGIQGLSASTGATLWSILTSDAFYGSPTYASGNLYVAGFSGTVYAIKAATRKTLWSVTLSAETYSSPAVVDGVVYIPTLDGQVHALNAATGATLWSYTAGGEIDGSPTVVNGVVYFGSIDSNIYALNATTGALLWKYATGAQVESTPAVVNGVLYCGSDDEKVYAIRTVASALSSEPAGSLIWSAATGGAVFSAISVAYGEVYASSTDGNLYAFDARTGAKSWSFATASYPRPAAVANGAVYFTSNDGGIYAIAANGGGLLWYGSAGGSWFGGPAVSDGVLYVNAYEGQMTSFALNAGNEQIRAPAHAPLPAELHPDLSLRLTR